MPSFSVRCIFRWEPRHDQRHKHLYEERITLWMASNIDDAIALAEEEARAYASAGDEYLEFCQAYSLPDAIDQTGVEVFSLLRESDLDREQYLAAFFGTGQERESAV